VKIGRQIKYLRGIHAADCLNDKFLTMLDKFLKCELTNIVGAFVTMNVDTPQRFTFGNFQPIRENTLNLNRTSLSPTEFVESVLKLQPRLAVFDCDGTLWSGDAGEGFFSWEMKRGIVSQAVADAARARYAEYRLGRVSEDDMCGEMATINKGLSEADVIRAADEYFNANIIGNIFGEVKDLIHRLHQSGCDVWAVSSTCDWVIEAAMKHFDIPADHVLAAKVVIENGMVTDRLVRVPSGEGKPKAIREVIRREPDAVFGNSRWDAAMLAIAKNAFAVNPNPDLEEMAQKNGWQIYWPESCRK
jgi:phosphoserine phosphatase